MRVWVDAARRAHASTGRPRAPWEETRTGPIPRNDESRTCGMHPAVRDGPPGERQDRALGGLRRGGAALGPRRASGQVGDPPSIVEVPDFDELAVIDANEAAIEATGVDLHSYTAPGEGHGIFEFEELYEIEVDGVRLGPDHGTHGTAARSAHR